MILVPAAVPLPKYAPLRCKMVTGFAPACIFLQILHKKLYHRAGANTMFSPAAAKRQAGRIKTAGPSIFCHPIPEIGI